MSPGLTAAQKVVVRAPNWVGDVVLSLPALHALRRSLPGAELAVQCRPALTELYQGQPGVERVLAWDDLGIGASLAVAERLRREQFDLAVLFPNAFRAAWVAWWAGIPQRLGYATDGRGFLLTQAVDVPRPGETPPHQSFYYLELLVRGGLLPRLPAEPEVQLPVDPRAREAVEALLRPLLVHPRQRPRVALVPGAAFGTAKRWLPERFAELAVRLVERRRAVVVLCGTAAESGLGEAIRERLPARGYPVVSLMGLTTLPELAALFASCDLVVGNDTGAAHVAAGTGVPLVTLFGPTHPARTRGLSHNLRVLQKRVSCSPCELRDCPVDHRCMTRLGVEEVWAAVEAVLGRPSPRRPAKRVRARVRS